MPLRVRYVMDSESVVSFSLIQRLVECRAEWSIRKPFARCVLYTISLRCRQESQTQPELVYLDTDYC